MPRVRSLHDRSLQSRDAVELLSDKWRVPVLHVLTPGPLRTHELQRALDQVSPKMLTQTLRGLERDGLIERRVLSAVPARVEYQLTTMGASVIPLLRDLCQWAEAHAEARDLSRRRFDAQEPPRLLKLNARPRAASGVPL